MVAPFRARLAPRSPLLYAALGFSAGIVVGTYAWRPLTWWLIAAVAFLVAALHLTGRSTLTARFISLAAWCACGALSIQLRSEAPVPNIDRFLDGQEVTVTAYVVAEGNVQQAGFGGFQQSIDVVTERLSTNVESADVSFGLRLHVYGKTAGSDTADRPAPMRLFQYGERLRFPAKLRWPRNYRNAGAFDYVAYLADRGIVAQGTTKYEEIEILPGVAGTRAGRVRANVHRSIVDKLHALWPPAQAALMDAMVIGDDAFIHRDARADFQRSGTYHILVVSGMNVGILAFVLFWILRRLRVGEILATVVVVLFSIAYAVLTDVGPPIWRATLMMALYLGVRLLYRDRSMLNAVGGAALCLLILDPKALLGASFQLTFLSVLIIGAIGIPLLERTSEAYVKGLRHVDSTNYDTSLSPNLAQFRLDLRMVAGRLARFLGKRIPLPAMKFVVLAVLRTYETLVISALMQAGLALPMAWYFHRATVMGLPSNLLVIPLTGILMPAAVAAVGLSYLSIVLAKVPALVAGFALDGITATVRWVGTVQVADLRVATPDSVVVVAAALTFVTAMIFIRRRAWFAVAGLALLSATAFWITAVPPRPQGSSGVLEVTAIDVGQADSTLLITPEGRTILVDAGGPLGGMRSEFDTGEDVVSPYLWTRRISRLDTVVVTHAHSDHMGGMFTVLRNFRPRELWIGAIPQSAEFASLLNQARGQGARIVQRSAGEHFAYGSVTVDVFWPPYDQGGRKPNNNDSLILRFALDRTAVLLEGDAERKVERLVSAAVPGSDLLKVGHNGSLTSTSPELLASVQPRWAVISVGAHNSFGHPRREILQRLSGSGAKVYRTDLNGAVTFYLDGVSVRPSAALR